MYQEFDETEKQIIAGISQLAVEFSELAAQAREFEKTPVASRPHLLLDLRQAEEKVLAKFHAVAYLKV